MQPIYRNRFDRKIFGVIGGIALRLRVDANILRLIVTFCAATPLCFIVAGIYIILSMILPEGSRIMIENPGKKLYRSIQNRRVFGLCGGLGDYFRIDPLFPRMVAIFLLIPPMTLPMIVTYITAYFLVPQNDSLKRFD